MTPHARSSPARVFSWAGAALFLASLLFCVVSFETSMGQARDSSGAATAIPADALLFSAFALHHSVFARTRVRDGVRRLVSERLERSVYVWVASLMLIAVCLAWQTVPGVWWAVTGGARWLLRVVQIAGVWLAIRSAAVIDVFELAGVRQLDIAAPHREFKTSGPYGWVRHPIYSSWLLMVFGEPTMTATRATFALVSCVYLLVAIPFEERSLRATTDGAYDRYSAQVPWKLIPRVY